MDEPKLELVMARMAEQLATIEAGTIVYRFSPHPVEYRTTPSLVTRSLLNWSQYNQPLGVGDDPTATQLDAGPVLGVMRSSGGTYERDLHGRANRPLDESYVDHQRVTVTGYIKATGDVAAGTYVAAGTWLNRLIQDHRRCLFSDPRLDGLARLNIEPVGDLDTDDGDIEPLAGFSQDWLIQH